MTDMEKLIVRCWSAVAARHEDPTPAAVAVELRKHVADSMMPDVELRMRDLLRQGAIPGGAS